MRRFTFALAIIAAQLFSFPAFAQGPTPPTPPTAPTPPSIRWTTTTGYTPLYVPQTLLSILYDGSSGHDIFHC